ncbi:MAG TPA: 23S rRNA (adenine(2503)-C(2))-methyltransferase RlmN [Deltaproteobacteria bacterium]|nr:MAG: 23S rRNA (adenine(2503)-C(2))-methyltransferase [Deltaproteobacteria bacterium GWA2_55_82]OGQ64987.1 MAG: 23S rRNA (adenine(2503)-C(2))-methyltransferase [Deltaproteobacteria bacterium RIFCSPLOWO2_02_FULL_55_12]OIJ73829.1 MAG: 23S rRNA (adenine(2503)-C(2))-methyltransferase [Deltaproteobacteria bacterium GWC2_55_46]HBG45765.1 23S rRNA (adenine(2503)-C(2))-methyltransferase RlmN [Deltaproteobacteria bacterium]HCY09816.1 23S rRNA (adenine(2503)-C(2))-methyltransferase RlmN [Deltaproteobac
MKNLRDFTYEELLAEVAAMNERPYRGEQIFRWVFYRRATDIASMTDISKAFRETLAAGYRITGNKLIDVKRSSDGTRKFLSELPDSSRIESVLIPETDRLTLCVSSQAGCALGCRFCMTGMAGFVRNLTLSELAGQVFSAYEILDEGEEITNIVLMGMGEPLSNYDNVVRFIGVLTGNLGFNFSHNKITLSTAGLVPAIKRFGEEATVNLAVSLNATTDEVRERLMPINRKYPIAELMAVLRAYPLRSRKYITIEYVLISGVNDTDADARRLVRLLRGIPCKVNLIPFNPFPGSDFARPSVERVDAFHSIVKKAGYTVIVRSSKGAEIQAACGQLKGVYPG